MISEYKNWMECSVYKTYKDLQEFEDHQDYKEAD